MAEVSAHSRFRKIFIGHFLNPLIALTVAAWAVWAMYGGASDSLEELIISLGVEVFLLTWVVVAIVAKVIRDW
jgi:hypothetical protein